MMSINKNLTSQECHNIHFNVVQQAQAETATTPAPKPRPTENKIRKENVVDPTLDVSVLQSDRGGAKNGSQSSDDHDDDSDVSQCLLDTVLSTADKFQAMTEADDGKPQTDNFPIHPGV